MSRPRPVTISDIAKSAGLGKATVSLALRDDPRIRVETRARVKKLAIEMGYKANPIVSQVMSQLRKDRSAIFKGTLALMNACAEKEVMESNLTFRALAHGFRERAEDLGFKVDEFWLDDPDWSTPERLKKVLFTRRIEGVAFVGMPERAHLPEQVQPLLARSVFVGLGVRLIRPAVHCCSNDQYATSREATRKMIGFRKQRVGLVVSRKIDRLLEGRFSAGFFDALREDTGFSAEKMAEQVWNFQDGDEVGFLQWYERVKPDAILTTHIEIADWMKKGPPEIREVALAHLDWDPAMQGWAGMNQNNILVGWAAVDLMTAHLTRRDLGLPVAVKTMVLESNWVDGKSLHPKMFFGG